MTKQKVHLLKYSLIPYGVMAAYACNGSPLVMAWAVKTNKILLNTSYSWHLNLGILKDGHFVIVCFVMPFKIIFYSHMAYSKRKEYAP